MVGGESERENAVQMSESRMSVGGSSFRWQTEWVAVGGAAEGTLSRTATQLLRLGRSARAGEKTCTR